MEETWLYNERVWTSSQALWCLCLAKHAQWLGTEFWYIFETDGKVLIREPELFFTEYEKVEQVVREAFCPRFGFH